MKKRQLLFFPLILIILFVTACTTSAPGDTPLDTETALRLVQSGTNGVEISIVQNYPPNLIYDQNELITLLEVKNEGNHNLNPEDCFVQITGHDPNIIRGNFGRTTSCAENLGVLEGKNLYNVEGSSNQLEFRSTQIELPPGVFEYEPTLNILSCYNYLTRANPSICVDPLFYQITSNQKACMPHDVSLSGGQGAPVGVSYVGADMVGSRAIFEIDVRNFGSGRVLSPFTSLQNCGQGTLDFSDLDRVRYTVRLGNVPGDCSPRDGFIRLTNNQGKIVCQFNVPGTVAYETPLLIDLDYNYQQSTSKSVKIISTPG